MSVAHASGLEWSPGSPWPALPLEEWVDTRDTLHRWMQIVGKIQLALTPMVNHWWNVTLRVTSRGFATSAMPCRDRWLEIELDMLGDVMRLQTSDGRVATVALAPRSVADFYAATMRALRKLGVSVRIWPMPVEIFEDPLPLDRDELHHAYDRRYALRFWQIVARTADVLTLFRARFIGKASPVQFFWGSFDLATTRFSGRRAPPMPGASFVEREAYSHEVISAGWWPGDIRLPRAAFYSYAAPEPAELPNARLAIPRAYYEPTLHGFYLDHEDVRAAADPDQLLLDFFQAVYAAAANLAHWSRDDLERDRG